MVTPHCSSGGCRQGRAPCPTKQACGIPEDPPRQYQPDFTIDGPHRAPPRLRDRLGLPIALTVAALLLAGYFFTR